jgi:hypothetical protein
VTEPSYGDMTIESALAADYLPGFLSEETQESLARALDELFTEEAERLDMPEDEEQGQKAMTEMILRLMDQAFKAGMVFQFQETPSPPTADLSNTVALTADQAKTILNGLLDDGVVFKVDRG